MTAVQMTADEWYEVDYLDPLPETHDEIVQTLVDWYRHADPVNIQTGRDWYRIAQREAIRLARRYGTTQARAAGILAVYSINNSWKENRDWAEEFLAGRPKGMDIHIACSQRILDGERPVDVIGHMPKVSQFYRAISGHADAITIDRWALFAAYLHKVPNSPKYANPAREAYREAAYRVGEDPRDFQAIVWIEARGQAF